MKMLDLLPQSLLSLEYYLKMQLHTESIVPKRMLGSCVSIAEKSKIEGLELEGGMGERP